MRSALLSSMNRLSLSQTRRSSGWNSASSSASLGRWKRSQELKNHEMLMCDAAVHCFLRRLWVCPCRRFTQMLTYTRLSNISETQFSCLSAGAKATPSEFETLQKAPPVPTSVDKIPKPFESISADMQEYRDVVLRTCAASMKLPHTVAPFLGRQSSRIRDRFLRSPPSGRCCIKA
jgi:hypothetical protein